MIPTNGLFVIVPVAITWTLSTTATAFTITVPLSSSSVSSSLSRHQRNNNQVLTSLDWSSYRSSSSNKSKRRLRRIRRISSESSSRFDSTSTQLSLALLPDLHFLLSSASEAVTATDSIIKSNSNLPHIPNLLQTYGSLLKEYPITTKCATASTLGCIGDFIAQFGAYVQQQKNQQEEQSKQQQQQQLQLTTSSLKRDSIINNNNNYEIQGTIIDHETPTLQRIANAKLTNNNNNNNIQFQYDIERGIAFFLFGAFYTGAFQHVWFEYLSNHVSIWGQELGIWDQSARAGTFSTALLAIADGTRAHTWFTCFDIKLHMDLPPSPLAIATAKVMINQFFMVPSLYMPLFFLVTGYIADLNAQQSAERCRSLYFPLLFRNYVFWLPVQLIQFLFVPVQWQIPVQSVASLVWTVILSSISSSTANANNQQQQQQMPSLVSPEQSIEIGELPETVMIAAAGSSTGGLSSSNVLLTNGSDDVVAEITQVDNNNNNNIPTPAPVVLDYTMNSKLDIFDEVTVKDVITEPIFESAQKILVDQKIGAASSGFALGLLSAAADEASLGTAIGALLGGETNLGVAVLSALGAGASILAASALDKSTTTTSYGSGSINATTTILESVTTVAEDSRIIISDETSNDEVYDLSIKNITDIENVAHSIAMEFDLIGKNNTVTVSESVPTVVDHDENIKDTTSIESTVVLVSNNPTTATTILLPNNDEQEVMTSSTNSTSSNDHLRDGYNMNSTFDGQTSSSATTTTTTLINDDLLSIENDIITNYDIGNLNQLTISNDSTELINHDIVTICQHNLDSNEESPCLNNCKNDESTKNDIKLTTISVQDSV